MHHRKPVARAVAVQIQPNRAAVLLLSGAACSAFWLAVAAAFRLIG